MNNSKFLFPVLVAVAIVAPQSVRAQCLTAAEAQDFQRVLRVRLGESELPVEDLYRLAHDKLGFGVNPEGSLASPPAGTRGFQLDQLAARIAESLTHASTVRRNVELQLGEIPRPGSFPDLPELPAQRYRHAASTMAEAYTETARVTALLADLRRRLADLPPGPQRDRLQLEYERVQRWRTRVNGDLEAAAPARLMAMTALGSNVDLNGSLSEFWANHFNIEAKKTSWSAVDYRRVLQRRMCGTFRGLLTASAKHPGMQIYLDNFRSKKGRINENYGRELLELHTLGDDLYRYYDQDDVIDAARVLTGWSVQFTTDAAGVTTPSFGFYPAAHDGAAVTMFDRAPRGISLQIAARSGEAAVARGEQLLGYLAAHPSTRANICGKLSRWLIGRALPETVAECAADAVWGDDGDLTAVYRFLLTRRELWSSTGGLTEAEAQALPRSYGIAQKTPIELVASSARAVATPSATVLTDGWLTGAVAAATGLGIAPAKVAPPTGYPIGAVWLSAGLVIRMQQHLFTRVGTERLGLPVGGVVRRGEALEAEIRGRVVAAGNNNTALVAVAQDLLRNGLKAPPSVAIPVASQLGALTLADQNKATREAAPARTLIQAYLGSARFTRK